MIRPQTVCLSVGSGLKLKNGEKMYLDRLPMKFIVAVHMTVIAAF